MNTDKIQFFFNKPKVGVTQKADAEMNKKCVSKFLDDKTSQNLSIALKGFKMPPEEIVDSIFNGKQAELDTNRLQILLQSLPDDEMVIISKSVFPDSAYFLLI